MKLKIKYEDFVGTYPKIYEKALFYPRFLELKRKGLSLPKIKKLLSSQIPFHLLYRWYKGLSVPLPFKDFSKIKKEFDGGDAEKLATIVGHVLGDGGISKGKILHYCNTEEFLIKEFQDAVEHVFNIKPMSRYKEESGIIRIRYPRLISRVLLCLFGEFSLGNKKRITPQIDRMPLWWKIKLIQALFNDEGSAVDSKNYRAVSFKQKPKEIAEWVKKVLKQIGINSSLNFDGRCWQLRILNYMDLLKFRNKVNFSEGYRKQIQLNELLQKIKYPQQKTKLEIIRLLKKKKRTKEELAKLLNLQPGTIYGHLHGWKRKDKKRKSTKGLVDLGIVKVIKMGRRNYYSLNRENKI
jgi:DNA-binding transcriptional ArsR family regulator